MRLITVVLTGGAALAILLGLFYASQAPRDVQAPAADRTRDTSRGK